MTAPTLTPEEARSLLREAIDASGLSARRWAREVAWRNERTIRRWLAGDSPVSEVVVERLLAARLRSSSPHVQT